MYVLTLGSPLTPPSFGQSFMSVGVSELVKDVSTVLLRVNLVGTLRPITVSECR